MLQHPASAYNPYAPSGSSSYASNAALTSLTPPCTCLILSGAYNPYACGCLPNMPPMLLTILTLAVLSQHASDTAYHPYTCLVPSQNASNTPFTLG
ncbi:hypothetical protein O181_037412 [Austropuccinia psidii MF-1]|uniref:Uncharacterized protein n=1 Tax=Austropuccinia psidii MF-1 TaxID=1389203 RepID=A0A9Q3HAW1_9BASI|nr:hypothetical protein [Austropuccinia psidii MF-1]